MRRSVRSGVWRSHLISASTILSGNSARDFEASSKWIRTSSGILHGLRFSLEHRKLILEWQKSKCFKAINWLFLGCRHQKFGQRLVELSHFDIQRNIIKECYCESFCSRDCGFQLFLWCGVYEAAELFFLGVFNYHDTRPVGLWSRVLYSHWGNLMTQAISFHANLESEVDLWFWSLITVGVFLLRAVYYFHRNYGRTYDFLQRLTMRFHRETNFRVGPASSTTTSANVSVHCFALYIFVNLSRTICWRDGEVGLIRKNKTRQNNIAVCRRVLADRARLSPLEVNPTFDESPIHAEKSQQPRGWYPDLDLHQEPSERERIYEPVWLSARSSAAAVNVWQVAQEARERHANAKLAANMKSERLARGSEAEDRRTDGRIEGWMRRAAAAAARPGPTRGGERHKLPYGRVRRCALRGRGGGRYCTAMGAAVGC